MVEMTVSQYLTIIICSFVLGWLVGKLHDFKEQFKKENELYNEDDF